MFKTIILKHVYFSSEEWLNYTFMNLKYLKKNPNFIAKNKLIDGNFHVKRSNLCLDIHSNFYNRNYKSKNIFSFTFICSLSFCFISYFYKKRANMDISETNKCLIFPLVKAKPLMKVYCKSHEGISPRQKFNFLADVAEKVAPSLVYIESRHRFVKQAISNGSGFIVQSDGLILTNAHVVLQSNCYVTVKLNDGSLHNARIVNLDSVADLAVLKIETADLPALPLGKSSEIRLGEFVLAMGNPLKLSDSVTSGVISSTNRDLGLKNDLEYIQTDASVDLGNSGGPLVNLDGEVIGINTLKMAAGISFAIPSDRIKVFLNESKKKLKESTVLPHTAKQRYLGITMVSLTPDILHRLRNASHFPNIDHGVIIFRVLPESPADLAGIQIKDIVTSINGEKIYTVSDVYRHLESGDTFHIHIHRKNKEHDIVVKF